LGKGGSHGLEARATGVTDPCPLSHTLSPNPIRFSSLAASRSPWAAWPLQTSKPSSAQVKPAATFCYLYETWCKRSPSGAWAEICVPKQELGNEDAICFKFACGPRPPGRRRWEGGVFVPGVPGEGNRAPGRGRPKEGSKPPGRSGFLRDRAGPPVNA